jgi:hypothetical protein
MLHLSFSPLAVLRIAVSILDLGCETRDTGLELMTHWNNPRGDASPSVLDITMALVQACQELSSGMVESCDMMVADKLGEMLLMLTVAEMEWHFS